MEGEKLQWMYRNASETVDREEYLLGRSVDKAFEHSLHNQVEKDCLPPSLFANSGSNIHVDIDRKKLEDPLEAIRQKEIESRKQLLKNPVKLKKLQEMLKKQNAEIAKKEKKKNKKKKEKDNLDEILAAKYLQLIMKKKSLNDISSSSESEEDCRKPGRKSRNKKVSSDESASESSSDERKGESKYKTKNKKRHRSNKSRSRSPSEKKDKQKKRESREKTREKSQSGRHPEEEKAKRPKERRRASTDSSSSDRRSYMKSTKAQESVNKGKKYGLVVPKGYVKSNHVDDKCGQVSKKPELPKLVAKHKPTKLSEKEKEERLNEMMKNAEWRDDLRSKNIKRYRQEEKEEKGKEFDKDFLRKQLALATSGSSVEQRLKSKINTIQRNSSSMSTNFARR